MDAAEEPSKLTPAATVLLLVGPVNHRNNKGKSLDSALTLYTMLVEPAYF